MEQGVGRSSRKPHSPGQARRSASTRRRGRLWINFRNHAPSRYLGHEIQRCMQCRRFCASTFLVLVVYLGCVENEAVTSKGTHPRSVRSNRLFFFSGNKNAAGGVQSLIACRSISDPVENRRKELRRISAYRIRFVFPGGGRERESPRIIPLISSFVNENILYIVSSAAYNHRLASIFVITIFYILKTPRVLKRK